MLKVKENKNVETQPVKPVTKLEIEKEGEVAPFIRRVFKGECVSKCP